MLHTVKAINQKEPRETYFKYPSEETCPICKAKIEPIYISSCLGENCVAYVFNYCRSCKETFIAAYETYMDSKSTAKTYYYNAKSLIYSEPNRFVKHVFDNKVVLLSPQFDKIYNQALAAEASQLNEIAGLGYRKALEFLIKDFAIHEVPNDSEKIKTMPLGQCIKNYIRDNSIKTLAERSAWIGNDEAHYIRKQENRDVSDMKMFIQAAVYFIGMILITEDAASMFPK